MRWLPLPHASISNSTSDSRQCAASFPSRSLARAPRADGTRPLVQLWLKKRAGGSAGTLRAPPSATLRAAAAPLRAAERPRYSASRRCTLRASRTRISRAAEFRGLLTGVIARPLLNIFLYFNELVYYFEIPVSEFYVKRHLVRSHT